MDWAKTMDIMPKLAELGVMMVASFALIAAFIFFIWQLKPMLISLTTATQAVGDAVKVLNVVLEKVSERLIVHDERSLGGLKDLTELKLNTATSMAEIVKLIGIHNAEAHHKLNEIKADMVTKEELIRIHNRMDQLGGEVNAVGKELARVCVKVGCE